MPDTAGMHNNASSFMPADLSASPRGPLVEAWPTDSSWVAVTLSRGVRLMVGPHDRWTLIHEGVGRVAAGWVEEA